MTALASSALLVTACGAYASAGTGGGGGLYGSAPKSTPAASSSGGVEISGFAFVATSVKAGATVSVHNADSVAHTLTIKSAGIDVQVPAAGTATFTAPSKPGSYALTCDFHHSMQGTLTVTA